jgi:hypothetical protein
VSARFIAWVPALVAFPINQLFGPIAAYNIAFLLCAGLAVPAMAALARGRGATPLAAATAGLVYALAPPVIGALANGQTCKAQVWVIPAVLAAMDRVAVKGSVGTWATLAIVTVAGAFSEPTYALLLGLALPVWALLSVRDAASGLRVAAAVAAVAGVFLVAARYYDVDSATSAFLPSVRLQTSGAVNQASQQASVLGLVTGTVDVGPTGTSHVTYLGVPALVVVALGAARGTVVTGASLARARLAVLALVSVGIVVALGEWLVVDEGFARIGTHALAMPGRLLAEAGYPLARSGQYYRALLLAWTGVALALALAPLGRLRAAVALLLLVDGLRVTKPLWPFPVREVPGRATWAALAADPTPGAVLDLPLSVGNRNLGDAMLSAALHGRAVQAIPVFQPLRDHPVFRARLGWVADKLPGMSTDEARVELRAAGFAFVTWRPVIREGGPSLSDLQRLFGPGTQDGDITRWKVDP